MNKILLLILAVMSSHAYADSVVNCFKGLNKTQYCKTMLVNYYKYNSKIEKISYAQGLDPLLFKALIAYESRFNPAAVSNKKAMGLTQIMPSTALELNVNPKDLIIPEVALTAGAKYLSNLLKQFNGRFDLALSAYNAGAGNVKKYKFNIPPFNETKNYVKKVLALYLEFKKASSNPFEFEYSSNFYKISNSKIKNKTYKSLSSNKFRYSQ